MLAQLQQFRVLDTALIQSCGYPVHLELTVFVQRYAPLLMGDKESLKKDDRDLKQVCHAICTNMKLSDYRMGNSQVWSNTINVEILACRKVGNFVKNW